VSAAAAPQRLSVPRWRKTSPKNLSAAQRSTLHKIADQLVPAAGDNPLATHAPDFDQWLDRYIAARRDAIDLLLSTLDQLADADGTELDRALRQLHAGDSEGRFHLISSIVAGAYLAGDHIRQLVGYPGQLRQPAKVDDAANELAGGILDPVLEPRQGGRVYETWQDDTEVDWGEVLVRAPPERFVMTWNMTSVVTEVELTFAELGPLLTRVAVEHRGWEQLTEEQLAADCALRGGYLGGAYPEGWARILGCPAAVTGGQS
jgi:hypothetical protein